MDLGIMSEFEDIEKQLNDERNKLMQLEIELNSIDSDSYFYQKNNDLDKLNELSNKKGILINQINSQKEVVNELEFKFNSIKSKHDEEEKQKEENIVREKLDRKKELKKETENKEKEKKLEKEKKAKKRQKQVKISKKKTDKRKKDSTIQKTLPSFATSLMNNKKTCRYCGVPDDGVSIYCQNCGSMLRTGTILKEENWFVKLFLKKKKDDGSHRFSISKIIGLIYAILEFWAGLFQFYFPENLIISLIAALIAYLICLIIGYIVRWVYNKYIK